MQLDTSSLTPIDAQPAATPSSASPGLDLSSLRPMGQADTSSGDDSESAPSSQATIGSVAKQAGLGLVSGIPHAVSGLADLLEKGTMDTLTFSDPRTGENQFKALGRSLGLVGGDAPEPAPYIPTTGQDIRNVTYVDDLPQPKNAPERVARGVGEGAVTMAAPLGVLGDAGLIGNVARGVTVGGLSGGSAEAASEVAPDKYKPLAGFVGGLAGGIAGEGLASIPSVTKSGVKAAADYAAPLTKGGQERLAATTLRDAATDPDAALGSLQDGLYVVPGSKPTTFQATGDMGLGNLERATATKNPADFQQRRADQNSARLDALSDIQSDGHPEAVSGFFRDQLSKIDQDTQALHDSAEQAAQQQAAGLGGGRTPEAYGQDIKDAVNPQIEAASNTARNAATQLGGGQPEVLGEQARTAIQNQLDAQKVRERALWSAVDPEGNLMTAASPIKQAADRLYSDASPETALNLSPAEKAISGVIGDYGQVLPFQRLITLRSAVSKAMRDARSPLDPNEPAYGRLSQLRGAIEDSMSDVVAQKAAQEQQAVATGAMKPEETFASRLQQEAQEFSNAKRKAAGGLGQSYFDLGEPDRGRPGVSDGQMGDEVPPSGESGRAAPTEESSGPFLDEEAIARLQAASAATAERKQTFGAKPVSQILQRPGTTQPYNMPSAGVTSSIWKSGNAGADTIRSTLRAAGNSVDAVNSVRNMAAQSLRDAARDGIVTYQIFSKWRGQHGPALSALEQVSPGSIARFENAARASEGLNRFENFNPQTASGVLPERYFATGEKGFGAVDDLRQLMGKDRAEKLLGDYAADSVRKASAKPDGTLDPKKFEAWQKSHSGALRALPDVQARFSTAAKASDRLASVAADRKDKLDAYQQGAIGKVLKVDDPSDVVKTVGSIFGRNDSVQQMRALAQEASKNPAAMVGLRKAIVEHMESKLISNTEAATSGKNLIKADAFQTFLGKNFTALRQVFNDTELNSMKAIAQDLKRANRSIASSKLPGQSNTAQDLSAVKSHDLGASLFAKVLTHAAGTGAGFLAGFGPIGAAAGFLGSHALVGLREAGIRNVEELIKEAMLDPELAKTLLMKAPKKVGHGSEVTFGARLRQLGMFSAANNYESQRLNDKSSALRK